MKTQWIAGLVVLCASATLAAEPGQGTGNIGSTAIDPEHQASQPLKSQIGTGHAGITLLQRVSSDMDQLLEKSTEEEAAALKYSRPEGVELIVGIR